MRRKLLSKLDCSFIEPFKKEYIDNQKSMKQVAEEFGFNEESIRQYFKQHNIPIRNRSNRQHPNIKANQKQKIKQYLEQGLSTTEIANKLNCKRQNITTFVRKNKLRPKLESNRTYKRLLKQKTKIIQLYKQTKNTETLAKKLNCSPWAVQHFLDKQNIKRKTHKYHPIPITDKQKLYDLHHKKMYTMSQIGKVYNCSGPCVRQFFDKHKIPRRSKHEATILSNQDPILARKRFQNRYKRKPVTLPSGKVIYLQGWEPQFVEHILENRLITENELNFKPNRIPYKENKKKRYYFPDLFIPKYNLMIEIKSDYILQRQGKSNQKLKERACRKLGYNYLLVLDNNFKVFDNFLSKYNK